MTATPNFVSGPATGAETGDPAAPAAAGPFVLNLCSSTTPMALAQTDLPELRRFTFFVSRRFEEGRERFRLHMGYFATLAEAEELLGVVREIYPGAWAGEAPGRKLRERAVAAAAAQAQHAAGPQPRAAAVMRTPAYAATPLPSAPAAHPAGMRVPVVHAAPSSALRAAPPVLAPAGVRPAARQVSAPPAKPVLDINTAPPPPRDVANPLLDSDPAPPPKVPAKPVLDITTAPPPPRKAPPAPAAHAVAPPAARAARSGVKPVFEDSNVREVLKALGDASATGETRQMRAPPPPRPAAPANGSLSDTQVLKLLETRREGGQPTAVDTDGGAIPMLKPDDTGTRLALKDAVANNAPVSFAVQLQWSVQPAELDKVPPLAIFSAYTLYTVEGSRDGRRWYGLRLGFFSDAISAKQVAHYVRSEFASVAVVPVSAQEKARATDQDAAAAHVGPTAVRRSPKDEFKLTDDRGAAKAAGALPASAAGAAASAPLARATAAARSAPTPRVAVGRALAQPAAQAAPPPPARPGGRGKIGARDNRGPQSLEETLEILGASQLSIDNGTGETLNESGVRHLRVEVQKNSPFSRLLERLSERLKKQ